MNIVLPFDPQYNFPNQQNQGTESAQLENAVRAAIPAAEASANANRNSADTGTNQQQSHQQTEDTVALSQAALSLSKQDESSDELSLSEDEQKKVQELKDRDREVKVHEQAHAAVGGQYAGAPSYEYETGPDGKRYAVGGEVSIDVSEESEPQDTVQKMQIVRAAALAPAEPSAQDLKVAAEASQKETKARAQMGKENLNESSDAAQSPSKPDTMNVQQNRLADAYSQSDDKIASTFGTSA